MPRKKRRTAKRKKQKKTATRRRRASAPALDLSESTKRQISAISQIGGGVFLLLVLNQNAGVIGDSLNQVMTFFLGSWGALFPTFLIASGLLHWFSPREHFEIKRTVGLAVCLLAFLGMMHMRAPLEEIGTNRNELAGMIGFMISVPFVLFASKAVGYTILTCALLIGVFVSFEPDFSQMKALIFDLIPSGTKERRPKSRNQATADEVEAAWEREEVSRKKVSAHDEEEDDDDEKDTELNIVRPAFVKEVAQKKAKKNIQTAVKDSIEMKDTRFKDWTFPEFDLLDSEHSELKVDDEYLKTQAKLIEEKLEEFGIDVTMKDAHPGPTVTQFTLLPSEGVKLSKIGSLKDDLALALAAKSLRIEAPIPGKSLVGIEMPNLDRTIVHLREILESDEFSQSESNLTLPLGRDVSGKAVVAELDSMPHLLIAGATGSGKSVAMNTILLSLLYQNALDQLKFILIDPKRVELMPYDGIPHLLTPVITESEKALQALRWTVAEMGRRLHKFSGEGVRNLDEYNEKQMEEENVLPRVVIVIDELSDLMMRQHRRDTETMVARISQMARATGMHLIIATQRPSVDVITGLIKANIPTRIAFRVVSAIDSRTILDSVGAEDLLGKGDMLYMTADTPQPVRIQGIYVSTKEVERVINAVKIAGGGEITEDIAMAEEEDDDRKADISDGAYGAEIDLEADDNGGDDLFFDAIRVVQEHKKASASLLQRQLKVGYARAARLLDIMEEKQLIGPADGAKARKIYMAGSSDSGDHYGMSA